ncbi:glutamate-1-semialdehyde 2,1-aminomutase [Methanoplanus endosymbiosus]|uniref:Glutamate-1-semialdehyde 2,1-aminomutase n=1 Tax=Methanoplanus endosymbiosus TaxID=33865 RepID=A0A9E7PP45_9EURY|nr:glutamate-1-semialdehyde 2,1-aminomutase [Methanoplanus endosymbiosus]UUX92469.1 glutamate-1-semialdehyde 2,1-aminomutase [Methanoplanus endosymbiosus]
MKSSELFEEAKKLIPGGVSSPVRAIKPYPFYVESAEGSKLKTADGEELIDCCLGYGPLILGHVNPVVKSAIAEQIEKGWLYGTPTPSELDLSRMIIADHPSIDMCRFVSSGSEATMAAIRLARGFSGKKDIIKIEGGFHGAHDGVLIKAGSGATTMGVPDSAGVIADIVKHTAQVPYNDTESLTELIEKNNDIAAFILEPVMGNVGPILPKKGYLQEVRKITEENGVLLICDEVICGYRLGIGGAQVKFGIKPDITTLGKVAGGGLPVGIFGGRREIMEMVAPSGPVYQAGTFSGNPLTLAAGKAAVGYLRENPEIYVKLEENIRVIKESLPEKYQSRFVNEGSMFKLFFRDTPPQNYIEAKESDTEAFSLFWKKMLKAGIFLPPAQFETNFISTAHSDADIEKIAGAYSECL